MADDSDDEPKDSETVFKNKPYDESVTVHDSEEVARQYTPTPRVELRKDTAARKPQSKMYDESDDDIQTGMAPISQQKLKAVDSKMMSSAGKGPKPGHSNADESGSSEDDDDEDEDDDDDDDDDDEHGRIEGLYNPADYEHLVVSSEIKELFQYISRYATQNIELEYRLQPFIPDFIPAVGDIDAFIKIGRVDGKPDTLGLTVLDEPCAKQSDPHVLDLTLRSLTKQSNLKQVTVKSIDTSDNNRKALDNWIKSISDLHRTQPAPTVHYAKNMPEIDKLMEEWPPEFEELLKEISLPSAELDCELPQYADLVCGLLDIPVHKSRIQSLHLLFTLYAGFKNSQHFQAMAGDGQMGYNASTTADDFDADRLTI
jgi:intraflagellar transport protein 46